MFRRFEVYALAPDAPVERVRALEAACRHCGRYIPDIIDCAVGPNLSDAPVELVWEHAYVSAEAYGRYMVHPFHATVLDRYLLPDAPERIVIDGPLGAGLYGYQCDRPSYRMEVGVRRLVLLRIDAGASDTELARVRNLVEDAPRETPDMVVSILAANTMGSAWFDGVTPVMGPPRWTHIWEHGFSSLDALDAYRRGASTLAALERAGWNGPTGGVVKRTAELFYRVLADGNVGGPEGA